jgi:dCTP deaminase
VLSDSDILDAMEDGDIEISPYDKSLLQPASLDVRLGKSLRLFEHNDFIDPQNETNTRLLNFGDYYYLQPRSFVLASTYERVALSPGVSARFEGKSSIGRLGLFTHVTAGFIDPGFKGTVTLELYNANSRPFVLYAGMKIGQLCFFRMDSQPRYSYGESPYGSSYQDQSGPTPSASYRNFIKGLPDTAA